MLATFKKNKTLFLFTLLIIPIIITLLIFGFQKEFFLAKILFRSQDEEKEAFSIKLIFVGDIMLDRGVQYMIETKGGGDYRFPFLKIRDYLQGVDILFGNLEGSLSNKGTKVGSIYSFRNDPKAVEGLSFTGFDILSVANNHIFDYGREAMEDTFVRMGEAKINYLGGGFNEEEAYSPVLRDINGTKIVFLGYTNLGSVYWAAKENKSGIAWLNEGIVFDIEKAKEKADIVIISIHLGEEYQSQPNSEQEYFAHLAIDSGADLVIGHHPHVIQPIEKYKEGFIAYSLGNFVFDQGFSEETKRGLLLEVLVEDKKIIEINSRQTKMNDFFQPELVENN